MILSMKKIFSLILLSLLVQSVWSQNGEGYDPVNPGDPDVYYTLTLEAAPLSGGTVSPNNRQKLSVGQTAYVNASPRLGYEFKRWMAGDSLVSTNSSFSFTMPEKDVVLTAYFEWNPEYNPQNPGDPDAEGYSHRVYFYATPSAGGYFNSSSFTLIEGKTTNIYAYPREGYRFESWMCNGEIVSTENPLNIRMGTSDIAYTATFVYNPVSPGEPSPNVFNAATGEVIIDNFTPGSLNSAIYTAVGSSDNYSLVQSITVIGRMQSSDFGFARSYRNCSLIDLSRTTGYTEVPSWSFEGAEALTKLILPASVERIGSNVFSGCKNLSELYCYVTTPPEVSENAFYGVESALVIKVPASAVSLYQKANGWKNFTILPVDEETCSMVINLPADASDGRYKNMNIELQNAISMQTYKYLITDRTSYTFANLIRNTSYNIYVKNAVGAVLGEKEKVMLGEEDVTITFGALRQPQTLTAKVLVPDGTDVTAQVTITWLNEDGSLIGNGAKINGVLEGTSVSYRILLPQTLAMQYRMPTDVSYSVKSSGNDITCQLQAFQEIALSGRILDVTTEQPISGATITVSQLLNGKYTKSISARSGNDGIFTINAFNEQSSVTVSANNYFSQTKEYADFSNNQQLGDISLKAITGAAISVNFTYTESVEASQTAETQNWFSDEANVTYRIVNQTKNKSITEFNVQNGSIVLLEEVAEGDVLSITAISKTSMFKDVVEQAVIDSRNRADVTFPIVELGGLKATFSESENNGVVGILYDGNGVLKSKTLYNGETLTISNLADGSYTLVTMGNSKFFNSVLNLSELSNTGLTEGRDYVSNSISIASGVITALNIASVPTFDESQFYYTGENTSFSANKSQVTIGNYITLRAKIDFKDEYATSVRDLRLVVDLPESCSFVDNSVLAGNAMGGYEVDGNRVTVNMNSLDDVVRFCVIPNAGGTCKPSAFVQFNYGGENILQPIGSAYFNAQNLALSVPSQTADSVVVVNGTAQTDCVVKVYDGNVMIGQTRSLANGRWSARVNLYKPYSHSFHNIYAEVESANGQSLLTDTKLVEFDKTMTQLKTITMLYNGNTIVFDQIEGTTSTNTYSYVPGKTDFTFIAQFTKNDTALVKNLEFKVLASDGTIRRISSTYSSRYNAWVGKATYDNSSRIPANVGVEYDYTEHFAIADEERINAENKLIDSAIEEYITSISQSNKRIVRESNEEFIVVYEQAANDSIILGIKNISNDELESFKENAYHYVDGDNDIWLYDSREGNIDIIYVWNDENAYKISITDSETNKSFLSVKRRAWWNNWGDLGRGIVRGINSVPLIGNRGLLREIDDYNYWEGQYLRYMENHIKYNRLTMSLLMAMCEDGDYRLSPTALDWYAMYKGFYSDDCDRLERNMRNMLDRYAKSIRQRCWISGGLQAASLIGGLALGAFTKAGAALNTWINATIGRQIGNFVGTSVATGFVADATGDITTESWMGGYLARYCETEERKIIQNYISLNNNIKNSYRKCPKKEEEDEEDDDEGKPTGFATSPLSPSVDPSGYVYEGVSSNRLQGVTATAYYMETTEDMYGVLHDEPRVWDAEEYAQENPLFTDENGMYQWDVPQGLWQVKFEKEGYETTYSEWLPVPPPQLEVNVGMVQSRQPEVKQTHAYKDGIEVEFDKYMQPALLNTENILVSQNGEYVEGEVKLLNEETAYADENVKYASKIRFVPSTPFMTNEVTLTVANRVKSYAGLQMQDSYQQSFDIEQELTAIKADSAVNVAYEDALTLTVTVLPAEASAGKTLHVKSSSSMIVSVETESVVLDKNGKASVVVTGELPGSASLSYTIDGYDLTATTIVNVDIVTIATCATPTASVASGSVVDKGTAVELFCSTEGATIYYTLDGSCPCNETDARKVYDGTPIIINENVTIKAMAIAPDMYESEIAEFTYIVDGTGIDDITVNGQIQIYPLPVGDKVNISAGGKAIKSVTISSMNGVVVASANKPATTVTLDVSRIPTGIYIINVTTVDSTFSRKILKVE